MPIRTITYGITVGVALFLTCCQGSNHSGAIIKSKQAHATPIPAYKIASSRDLPFTWHQKIVHRLDVRVTLPRHYLESQVIAIAKHIVATESQKRPVNAISMAFYGPNSNPSGAFSVAKVDWAPEGKWENADSVKAGDYSTFRYSIDYIPPRPTSSSLLVLSSKKAIYGIPLPKGAKLVEKFRGSKSPLVDPYEKYHIRASAAQIKGFYEREMPHAGWKQYGPSSLHSYKRGKVQVIIIVDEKGDTFKIMGS